MGKKTVSEDDDANNRDRHAKVMVSAKRSVQNARNILATIDNTKERFNGMIFEACSSIATKLLSTLIESPFTKANFRIPYPDRTESCGQIRHRFTKFGNTKLNENQIVQTFEDVTAAIFWDTFCEPGAIFDQADRYIDEQAKLYPGILDLIEITLEANVKSPNQETQAYHASLTARMTEEFSKNIDRVVALLRLLPTTSSEKLSRLLSKLFTWDNTLIATLLTNLSSQNIILKVDDFYFIVDQPFARQAVFNFQKNEDLDMVLNITRDLEETNA